MVWILNFFETDRFRYCPRSTTREIDRDRKVQYNLTSLVKYTGVDKKKCKKILAGRQTKRPSMYIVQTGMNDRGKHKYRRQENWQDIEKNTKG